MSAASGSTVSQDSLSTVSATAESAQTHDRPGSPKPALPKSQVIQQFAAALHKTFLSLLQGDGSCESLPETPRLPCKKGAMRYRGVTKHKRTQRFEAHIWEAKKQIYLGGFDTEALAAKSHDIMALRCKGPGSDLLNFPPSDYALLIPIIDKLSRDDVVTSLRNYSKAQFNKKSGMGAKGGVHKVAVPRMRRATAAPGAAAAGASLPKLKIKTARQACCDSDEGPACPTQGEQCKGGEAFEGKAAGVRHSPRLLQQPRRNDSMSLEPFTPVISAARPGTSRTLRASSKVPASPPAGRSPPRRLLSNHSSSAPFPCSPLGWEGAGGAAPPNQAVAEAIALLDDGAAGTAGAASLFPLPAAQQQPSQATRYGGGGMGLFTPLTTDAASPGRGGAGPTGPSAAVGWVPAMHSRVPQDVAGLDDLDLDDVLGSLAGDEPPSLTFSASEEGRLYEWTPVDSAHSGLENTLTGTVLFRSPQQRAEHDQSAQALSQDASASTSHLDMGPSSPWAHQSCISLQQLPPHYFWPSFIPGLPATPLF